MSDRNQKAANVESTTINRPRQDPPASIPPTLQQLDFQRAIKRKLEKASPASSTVAYKILRRMKSEPFTCMRCGVPYLPEEYPVSMFAGWLNRQIAQMQADGDCHWTHREISNRFRSTILCPRCVGVRSTKCPSLEAVEVGGLLEPQICWNSYQSDTFETDMLSLYSADELIVLRSIQRHANRPEVVLDHNTLPFSAFSVDDVPETSRDAWLSAVNVMRRAMDERYRGSDGTVGQVLPDLTLERLYGASPK